MPYRAAPPDVPGNARVAMVNQAIPICSLTGFWQLPQFEQRKSLRDKGARKT
jgi:hypothetical protein